MLRLFARTAFTLSLAVVLQTTAIAVDLLATYRAALENDPIYLSEEYRFLIAAQARPQALSALLPQITFDANAARTEPDDDSLDAFDSSGIELTLTQSIYNRVNYITLSQADLQIEQARAEYASARQSLLLRSAERYFAVLAARDNLEFTGSEKNAIQRQLEQAERRFEVGLIAITDVKEAQARYDLAVAEEIAADNQLATAREAMRALTNDNPKTLQLLDEASPLIAPNPANIETWVATARDNNPSLKVARLATEIAKKSIGLERAARYPDTQLIGTYIDRYSDGVIGDSRIARLRIQVSVPIYTGGLIGSRVRQANASFELARQLQDSEQRATEQQTRDAYRSVLAGISQVKALKQAVISTLSGAEATQAGFDVGTRTAVEVLIALREAFRAQTGYSSARYDFILDTLRLKQASGILVLEDLEQVNSWLSR